MNESFIEFLKNSPTPYHVCENIQSVLEECGFVKLSEGEDWNVNEGGKYFVVRGSGLVAFTVGSLDDFSFKIAAAHTDSCALKIKENPLVKSEYCALLNVETYGGGAWHTFLDRPLQIAGRVIKRQGSVLKEETVTSSFLVQIPSLAIHQNRTVNDGLAINAQTDLKPMISLNENGIVMEDVLKKLTDGSVVSYDLFLVNADLPHSFGLHNEFLSSPRLDDLASVYAGIQALLAAPENGGINVFAAFNSEEIGSVTPDGADGDFLENTLRRITYALRFDDNEYYKALSSSFLLSVDNAHATHPNHPEKTDPTNRPTLGGGIAVKSHASGAYITDALSSAIVKTLFDNAEVIYQAFFNRSDVRSGSTLGVSFRRHLSLSGADIGITQLSMHSANETIAWSDLDELTKGLTAYYASTLHIANGSVTIE